MSDRLRIIPAQASPDRLITVAIGTHVYQINIIGFVILQAYRMMEKVVGDEPTAEQVSDATPEVAKALCADGWFTHQEYVEAWAASEIADMDDELLTLLEDEGNAPQE